MSIVIATSNRADKLFTCIKSILSSTYSNYEIIIIANGDNGSTRKVYYKFNSPNLLLLELEKRGISRALNYGIRKSRGEIIFITADDCLLKKNTLENIIKSFRENRNVGAIFGKVLPFRPFMNKGKSCLSFRKRNSYTISDIKSFHYRNFGLGNNISIKKTIFRDIGLFAEWLGPGTTTYGGEDFDFSFRAVKNGYNLLYDPKISIYHNNWFSSKEFYQKLDNYMLGFFACLVYHLLKGDHEAIPQIQILLKEKLLPKLKPVLYCIKHLHPRQLLRELIYFLIFLLLWIKATIIGVYFSLISGKQKIF